MAICVQNPNQNPERIHQNLEALQRKAAQCPVCFESGKETARCLNNHDMCVACFYRLEEPICSQCRGSFPYNQFNTCLQCKAGNDLRFAFCKNCNVVSASCVKCSTVSCCGAAKTTISAEDKYTIRERAKAFIEKSRDEYVLYKEKQLNSASEKHEKDLKRYKNTLDVLTERIKQINANIEAAEQELAIKEVAWVTEKSKEAKRALDFGKGRVRLHVEDLERMKKGELEIHAKMSQFKETCEANINTFSQRQQQEEERIKKMIQDTISSELFIENRDAGIERKTKQLEQRRIAEAWMQVMIHCSNNQDNSNNNNNQNNSNNNNNS